MWYKRLRRLLRCVDCLALGFSSQLLDQSIDLVISWLLHLRQILVFEILECSHLQRVFCLFVSKLHSSCEVYVVLGVLLLLYSKSFELHFNCLPLFKFVYKCVLKFMCHYHIHVIGGKCSTSKSYFINILSNMSRKRWNDFLTGLLLFLLIKSCINIALSNTQSF